MNYEKTTIGFALYRYIEQAISCIRKNKGWCAILLFKRNNKESEWRKDYRV